MCVNKYNQGKLKLTRYIYWTSPLAKAKGNVWQSNNNTPITPTPQNITHIIDATYSQPITPTPNNRCNIQPTYNQRFDGRYYLGVRC